MIVLFTALIYGLHLDTVFTLTTQIALPFQLLAAIPQIVLHYMTKSIKEQNAYH